MGLRARYYPIAPDTLREFSQNWHQEDFWKTRSAFTSHTDYFGLDTAWAVIDFMVSSLSNDCVALQYAVRGHEFPAPDGSVNPEPHMPSYEDEYWQTSTYVTPEEVQTIAAYLSSVGREYYELLFDVRKMRKLQLYRLPVNVSEEQKHEYFDLLEEFTGFYNYCNREQQGMLICIS
jgi:hypothetical protein